MLPRLLPQRLQRSFRSISLRLVCGGRPCSNTLAATCVRLPHAPTGREDHMPGAQVFEAGWRVATAYVPVRFDTDHMAVTIETYLAALPGS